MSGRTSGRRLTSSRRKARAARITAGMYGRATISFAGGYAPDHVPPISRIQSHALGCSVTGGVIYRGAAIAELQAVYLFGDWCSGRVWGLWRDGDLGWRANELMNTEIPVSSFGAG